MSDLAAATWTWLFDAELPDNGKLGDSRLGQYARTDTAANAPATGATSDTLIARLRARDETALRAIVDTYGNGLLDFATTLLHSRENAQDIVQDVLYAMWQQGDQLAPKGSLSAYLFAAVRNRALNILAHEAVIRRSRASIEATLLTDADREAAPSFEERDEWEAQVRTVRRAIAELTEHQRTALDLRYNRGLTIPEIAHVLGITPKGVERLMTRIRQLLRDAVLSPK